MEIQRVQHHKKDYLDLLLLGDEQEDMIDRYLERGHLYVLMDDGAKSVCVVTDEGNGVCELKNLATDPQHQRKGYGSKLVRYIQQLYSNQYDTLTVGTGEVPSVLQFYRNCGFRITRRIKGFFTEHYNHPIIEEGVLLADMIYLECDLKQFR